MSTKSKTFVNVLAAASIIYCLSACHESPYMQGSRLYASKCQNCHMEDGSGLGKLIPNLTSSSYLGKTEMACIIAKGKTDTIWRDTTFLLNVMPDFGQLSTTELTNIINYINHKWHQPFEEKSILDIQNVLESCTQ